MNDLSKKNYLRKNKISGQFSARTIAMMESPAYQVLSLSGRRVLDRLEIEHAHHGGNDNGELPCTYDDFESYGIHRHSIKAAIAEVVALGFVEITEQGRAGNAEWRRPTKYRLTYRPLNRAAPTDEWRKIKSLEEALMLAKGARTTQKRKHFPVAVAANSQCGKRTTKGKIHSAETTTTSVSAETTTTSIFRTGDRRDRLSTMRSGAASPSTLGRYSNTPASHMAAPNSKFVRAGWPSSGPKRQ